MKIRGITVERRKDYNAATHIEELKARAERLTKVKEDMPKEAHRYVTQRIKDYKQVRKSIRQDRS